ncbi:hypothetical protein BC828DRAFT_379055 [Blastocladiella britannica]|nr:hypothetical protein BC828DRAFT_379055 [Blastocladiella britannica]
MHPTSRLWLLVFLACAWCTHGVNVLMRKTVSRWQLYEDQLAAAARGSGVEINLFTANTSTEIPVDDFFSALKVMETQHWSVYDVVYVDVIWPAMLTSLLLPLEHTLSSAFLSTIDKGSLSAGYVNGSLYAIPVYGTDVGLFYRADLLAKYGYMGPPETWAQMEEMMDRIIPAEHAAGHPSLAGYLGQLDGYEGATCNIMELLESYDAGGIIETQTDPVTGATSLTLSALNATKRANAMSALSMWQRWQQKGHFPTSALSFAEVNTLNLWRRGDVLFMRLWYLLPFLPIPDVPGADPQVAPLPGFTAALRGSAVNGANMVGVNRHSAHPDQAGKVLEAFLSSQFQHFVASIGEGTPMLTALKQDRSVCQLMNSCNVSSSQRVVSRPSAESGAHYSAVSSTIYSAFRIALLNVFPADHSIDWLTDRLGEVLNIKLGETRIVEWQSASSYFVIALSFLSPATAVALALLAMRTASNQGRLRRAEIGLISSMGAGMALLSAWPVLFLGPRTTLQCMLQPVFPGMGATVILTAVASHDLRVYLIVSSPLRRVAADVYRAMRVYSTLCILAEAAALALWAGMNQSVPTEVPAGYRVRNAGCSNGDYPALLSISVVVVFALMFAVAWLSWHANNLQSAQPLGRVPTLRVLYMLFMTGSICDIFVGSLVCPATTRAEPARHLGRDHCPTQYVCDLALLFARADRGHEKGPVRDHMDGRDGDGRHHRSVWWTHVCWKWAQVRWRRGCRQYTNPSFWDSHDQQLYAPRPPWPRSCMRPVLHSIRILCGRTQNAADSACANGVCRHVPRAYPFREQRSQA